MVELVRMLVKHLWFHHDEPVPEELLIDLPAVFITWLYAHGQAQGLEQVLLDRDIWSSKQIEAATHGLNKYRSAVESGQHITLDELLSGRPMKKSRGRPRKDINDNVHREQFEQVDEWVKQGLSQKAAFKKVGIPEGDSRIREYRRRNQRRRQLEALLAKYAGEEGN